MQYQCGCLRRLVLTTVTLTFIPGLRAAIVQNLGWVTELSYAKFGLWQFETVLNIDLGVALETVKDEKTVIEMPRNLAIYYSQLLRDTCVLRIH